MTQSSICSRGAAAAETKTAKQPEVRILQILHSDCKLSFGQKLLTTGLTSNWENTMIKLLERDLLYFGNYLGIRAGTGAFLFGFSDLLLDDDDICIVQ